MDENGRVHPGCANAANPYHECGAYCLEKITDGKGGVPKAKDKKKLDNRYATKEPVRSKRTDQGGRMQTNCPKSSNPYHECNEFCMGASNTNTQGFRKQPDIRNGIKNELSEKKDVERKVYPTCPKASNPYHQCDENCSKRNTDAASSGFRKETGSKILDAPRSFDRKKNGPEAQPKSSRAPEITPAIGAVYLGDTRTLQSYFSSKNTEAENGETFSSEQQYEDIHSEDQSFDNMQIQNSQSVPMSGKIMSPANTQTRFKTEKVQNPPKEGSDANSEEGREDGNSSTFSFSGIIRALEENDDDEEVESVISDSCVSVGKYHVKASISSILQSIFDKYGDIAANCQLESASMRAYYLECLCAVIQELQSTSFNQLTKAKIKEMFAVLKDVESANIDVSWLRASLSDISEAIELLSQRQTFEAKKAQHNRSLEPVKKELESKMEALAQKEKEAADAREQVAEIKTRLDDIERERSQLDKTISSIVSITEKFQGKSLADVLL